VQDSFSTIQGWNAFSSIFATEACEYLRLDIDALNRKAFSNASIKMIPSTA
jgi:hypothetical protein